MLRLLILLVLVNAGWGFTYNGLRVKFGWSDALQDQSYFFKIPRTLREAEIDGWKRTERPPGVMPELRLYCPPGREVCPLYDPAGFVAGLQIALPMKEFDPLASMEKKLVKWRVAASDGEPEKDYWTVTQYYVSEESLKGGAGPRQENGATLQDDGVWVAGPNGKLMRIPISEVEVNNTLFKKQNCVPNMGTHYYYNMTPALQCEELFPWFALTTQGSLVGTGFQMVGSYEEPKEGRDWFERPPPRAAKITVPTAPECLYKWASSYGVISLHVYYVDDPWTIRCSNGDSIQPSSVVDRLLINGERYTSKVVDEFKKWFNG